MKIEEAHRRQAKLENYLKEMACGIMNDVAIQDMAANLKDLSQGNGGQLNPTWVEWLMGFPIGWTDLGASETP